MCVLRNRHAVELKQARAARSTLAGVTGDKQKSAMQGLRVFYRRELEARPFVIARTGATQPLK